MNEFIVWDVKEVELIENEGLCIDENGKVRSSNGVLLDEDSYKPFFYIGLTDIDGKKIYADCSIVEFDDEVKSKAYVRMRNYAYEFYFFESGGYTKICDFNLEKTRFKIIDTIQENKLGLIKC
jgi:hypothetical protein